MSSSFIGSKIAIITKSQCRYTGTIIGIDAQASSIILGNVKCLGTENRGGNFSNNAMIGTIVPIMQFANSDIEDLKIVEEDPVPVPTSSPPAPPQRQPSIHDDPAIVSAVVSSTKKDSSMSNRLIHDLEHLNLSDKQSKTAESRIRPNSGEVSSPWSALSSHQQDLSSGNRSKFFDGYPQTNPDQFQSNRSQQRWPSNTHSTQTSHSNEVPVRQPFFSNDRYQNGHMSQQQRYGYTNRRGPMNNPQRRSGGGNRETFYDNGYNYDDDFDFETSNQKFNKIASEDEFKQQSDSPSQYLPATNDADLNAEYEPIYDKKKSFFDSIAPEETSDGQAPMYNRTRNQDTFGYDRNSQQRNRGGYRRSNNNNYRQQGNEDFYYRQNNNGYQYRY